MSGNLSSLTSKQRKVYYTIEAFIKSRGIPPTVREIGEMAGEKTPGAIQGILNRLEQKGVIKREVGMARSIQLVNENSQYAVPVYIPEIKKISRRNIDNVLNIYNIIKYHPFSPEVIEEGSVCFVISCPDNSLFQSSINYNDTLIICKSDSFKDGDIVLVLYDDHVLLRRYYSNQNEGTFKLTADSDLINKEIFTKNEVNIIGKLVGKYTRF